MNKFRTAATIHSFTDPEKKYKLKVTSDGKLTCNCPSWIFNQRGDRTCKHTDAVDNHSDNLETLILKSGRYQVEINGNQWIIEKVSNGNGV